MKHAFKIKMFAAATMMTALTAVPTMAATIAWDGAGATDTVDFSQFGAEYNYVASGSTFTSVAGLSGTFSTSLGTSAERLNQSDGWNGTFAPGATLLWNEGSQSDLTFTFNSGISAVGAQFQSNYWGDYTAQIVLSDGTAFTEAGVASGNGDNSAIFIGAKSSTANITSITFHAQSTPGDGNDFAIGNLSVMGAASAVPEPASWAMMIGGIGLAGGVMRRQRRVTAKVALA